jgi:hypothetical protein
VTDPGCMCFEIPGRTVTIVYWEDETVQLIADQDPTQGDLQEAWELLKLLCCAPLGVSDPMGNRDVWTTRRVLEPGGSAPMLAQWS